MGEPVNIEGMEVTPSWHGVRGSAWDLVGPQAHRGGEPNRSRAEIVPSAQQRKGRFFSELRIS